MVTAFVDVPLLLHSPLSLQSHNFSARTSDLISSWFVFHDVYNLIVVFCVYMILSITSKPASLRIVWILLMISRTNPFFDQFRSQVGIKNNGYDCCLILTHSLPSVPSRSVRSSSSKLQLVSINVKFECAVAVQLSMALFPSSSEKF